MTTKTGGTVTKMAYTPAGVSATVSFPEILDPPPPQAEVVEHYTLIDEKFVGAFENVHGSSVLTIAVTTDATGAITGVTTERA